MLKSVKMKWKLNRGMIEKLEKHVKPEEKRREVKSLETYIEHKTKNHL